jgi:HEAT repeat protein
MRADVVLVNSSTNALPAVTAALTDPTKTYARGPLLATIRSMRPPQEVARPLVPLMIQLMDQKPYPEMAALTLGVLRAEPQASAPALVRFLDNPQRLGRYYAICALTNFPSQAEIILPALTNALSDTNQLVRRSASNSIQSIVAEAQPQLPR